MRVLITGANGQLAKCIKEAGVFHAQIFFTFVSKDQLDISDEAKVKDFLNINSFDYCINTAAYTNVEKAESESEQAFAINTEGARYLAEGCEKHDITLLHISTDYVFDGKKSSSYKEIDETAPLNVYGATKLFGEQNVSIFCQKHFIIRTSWLYSQHGNNFYTSMRSHFEKGTVLKITTEQIGTPTNANDLAQVLLRIINSDSKNYGIYHFSNEGEATWYDFASAILAYGPQIPQANLANTNHYPTFAKRPARSVLDTKKIKETFGIVIPQWNERLKGFIVNENTQP
jgi:dTDP-4-dehydrorhamnose reductase